MRSALVFGLALLSASPALAQGRYTTPVQELSNGALQGLVNRQQPGVRQCAARTDTNAFLADVRVNVTPGARPSTMFNARYSVSVRSRRRDGAFEDCVRRAIREGLRRQSYAVVRRATARRTFQISAPREPIGPRAAAPYSESAVRRVLSASNRTFAQCLEIAGVPDRVTLRVNVERDGRLTLANANIPGGSSGHALGCLGQRVARLRVEGRPGRRVMLVHTVAVRTRAY